MAVSGFFARSELTRALWAFRREFWTTGALSMVINVLMLAPTLYMLQVFDRVMMSHSGTTLIMLSLLTLALFIMGACAEWLRSLVLVRAGVRFDAMLSTRVFNASFQSNLRDSGDHTGKIFGDLVQLRQFLTGQGIFALFDAPWAPIYLVVVFMLHPFLGFVAIFFALVQLGLVWLGQRHTVAPAQTAQQAVGAEAQFLQSKLRNAEVLYPMGMLPNLRALWQRLHGQTLQLQGGAQEQQHRMQAVSKFVRYTQQSLALGAGALLVVQGELSPGAMIAANMLMTRALAPIDLLVGAWRGMSLAKGAFARLEALLRENPERDPALTRVPPTGALTLRDVVAVVPERKEPILKGVSLQVQPASVTVVLGPSGSGKSTLARCILGIWPQMAGEVLLDERPIQGWNRDELGAYIGYLPQDIELFEGTIAENIARLGEVDAQKVIAAAKDAGLHEMILRFPKGYDTSMGEAGNLLSGGQRQRIGLARAIYGQPALVVLDEPNANLDDVGEAALVQAVQALRARGSAVVLITHRPGILAVADNVVILKDGVLQAQGPRDAVLAALRAAQPAPAPAQAQVTAAAPDAAAAGA